MCKVTIAGSVTEKSRSRLTIDSKIVVTFLGGDLEKRYNLKKNDRQILISRIRSGSLKSEDHVISDMI